MMLTDFKLVKGIIADNLIPEKLVHLLKNFAAADHANKPFIFIRNMPIDENVTPFDNQKPVFSKYE